MNIALTGLSGTGKTTVARQLARLMDKKIISINDEIENKTKLSMIKFVKKYGWERLREIEAEIVDNISDFDDCIFDTNEGIVVRNENIINLKKNSLIVLLTTDSKTLMNRFKKDNISFLKSGRISGMENSQELELKHKKAADYAIDTSGLSPEEVCNLIIHYAQMEIQ